MSFRVEVLPRAKDDVIRIVEWLMERSEQGAYAWFEPYRDALESLREDPDIWSYADVGVIRGRPIHQLIFKTSKGRPYRMLYCIFDRHVEVLHIQSPGQSDPSF